MPYTTTQVLSGLDGAFFRDDPNEYVVTSLGSNRDICFSSLVGIPGSIEIEVAGFSTPLSVSVVSDAVTVHSATSVGGSATSTAAQIVAAVNAHAQAKLIFHARLPFGQDGSGVTGALSHTHAANGTAFTEVNLVDSGPHHSYQAALGYRYWDEALTLTIEKQTGGAGPWNAVTPDLIYYIQGRIYFTAAQGANDKFRATGTHRDEGNFVKLFNAYNGQLSFNKAVQDASNVDGGGFEESVQGLGSFQYTADTYFYYDLAHDYLDLRDLGVKLLSKLYSYATNNIAWIGYGQITGNDLILTSLRNSQSKKITFKGDGELYPEMGA